MRYRKQIRRLLSFLAIVCCLAGSAAPAAAAGAGDGAVVFTNEPKNSADLYVTKTVENADPERAADLFQFVLLRPNGQKADPMAHRTYRLYQLEAGGGSREILKKDKVGNIIPFETDGSGLFTLEAGQRACFENLGAGVRYEVRELDAYQSPRDANGTLQPVSVESRDYYALYYRCAKDDEGKRNTDGELLHGAYTYRPAALGQGGYSKVQPVGGTTGTRVMPVNGDMVDFTNHYTGDGGSDTANLIVSKKAVWPAKWTAPVTDDFWFRVEVDRGFGLEAYGGREYTLTDPASPDTATERTAADGTFSLRAGCSAVFTDIPAGADYRVCEIVKGTRINPEDPSGPKLPVSLPEGWKAAGTATVTETGSERTEEVVRAGAVRAPETQEDFTNSNLSFVVTKKLDDNGKPDVDFAFQLTDAGNNGMPGSYYLYKTTGEPVYYEDLTDAQKAEDSGYTMGPEVQEEPRENPDDPQAEKSRRHLTVRTVGTDGAFTLKAGQAAVFTGMEEGTSFRVVETGTPSYVQMLPLPADSGIVYQVNPDTIRMLDFTNRKVEQAGGLTVLKQVQNEGGEGSLNIDEKFRFILYQRLKTAEDLKKYLNEETKEAADGKVTAGLANGTLLRSEEGVDTPADSDTDAWKTDYRYTEGGKDYEIYVPMEGVVYTRPDEILPNGTSSPNEKTGPDGAKGLGAGEFTLQAGKTVRFDRLDAGGEYLVRETGLTFGYTEVTEGNASYKNMVVTEGDLSAPVSGQAGTLTADGLAFTFVNRFRPEKTDLTITKTDEKGNPLPGAEFMLYLARGREQENKYLPADLGGMTPEAFCYRTDEKGQVTITDLKLGTYWLYETKAPHNYILLREPVELQATRGADGVLQVTVDGRPADNAQGGSVKSVQVQDTTGEGKAQIRMTIINSEYYKLPSTGSIGIYWYLISGILLMMAAVLISYKYQRRGRC